MMKRFKSALLCMHLSFKVIKDKECIGNQVLQKLDLPNLFNQLRKILVVKTEDMLNSNKINNSCSKI